MGFDPTARGAECGQRGTRCHCQDCQWCGEIVLTSEDSYLYANGPVAHRACALRQVIGSVAHLEHRCSCYVPGAAEGDPEGMTRRAAAQAAMRLWYAQRGGGDRADGDDDDDDEEDEDVPRCPRCRTGLWRDRQRLFCPRCDA